jgi:hypothetical protein
VPRAGLASYARHRQKLDGRVRAARKWFGDFSRNSKPGDVAVFDPSQDVYDDGGDLDFDPVELDIAGATGGTLARYEPTGDDSGDYELTALRDVPGPARKRNLALGLGLTFLGFGVIVALVTATRPGGVLRRLPAVPGLDPAFVALAAKWAAAYKLPLQWVLATILAESNGDPNIVGDRHIDPQGASIGLMQVNSVAHAADLAAAGLTRASLFDPNINIQWGTKILRRCVDRVQKALAGRPGDVGLLARLCYTGALKGTDATSCPTCSTTAARWQERLAQTAMSA